jgi:precorrin-4/cobalt-precorrin-4 C11-methyltransferase
MVQRIQVHFVGAGPGDPELITLKAQRVIREADLVLYAGSLVPKEIVAQADPKARVVDSAPLTLQETHALMVETVTHKGLVARVHTGDPAIYGAIKEQMALLDTEGISYAVIPGVTAACATAAAAKVSLTLPERTQTVILTRVGGRTPVPDPERLETLAQHQCSLALYLSASQTQEIVHQLLSAGYDPNTPVVVGFQVGWPGEKVLATHLCELEQCVVQESVHRQVVFLILPHQDEDPIFSRLYSPEFGHLFRGT